MFSIKRGRVLGDSTNGYFIRFEVYTEIQTRQIGHGVKTPWRLWLAMKNHHQTACWRTGSMGLGFPPALKNIDTTHTHTHIHRDTHTTTHIAHTHAHTLRRARAYTHSTHTHTCTHAHTPIFIYQSKSETGRQRSRECFQQAATTTGSRPVCRTTSIWMGGGDGGGDSCKQKVL